MSTVNSSPKLSKNKITYSVLLSLSFIGIFFLSYYIYSVLSVNFFKENYRAYIGELLSRINQEVQIDLRDNGAVNINRIIEPYLSKDIDLVMVYRTNQELIQVFTKKGVTKDNLRIADQTYFLNQSEAESVYLDDESAFVIATSTNNGGIILGSITSATIAVADFPYHYVLVFSINDYLKSRQILDATISRNSFFGGISMLALLALGFLIKEISSRSRERKNTKREVEALKRSAISSAATPTSPASDTSTTSATNTADHIHKDDPLNTAATSSASSTKPEFDLEDFIDHDEGDPMFGADPISSSANSSFSVPETSDPPSDSTPNLAKPTQPTNDEQAIQTVDEKNRKFLKDFLEYFFTSHAPSSYTVLEDNANNNVAIRDFNTIENERANLEQSHLYSHRLKALLQIWILAQPDSSLDLEHGYQPLIEKSLAAIAAPLQSSFATSRNANISTNSINTMGSMGLAGSVADYALPDIVGYFRPEHNPREITGKPVLTALYPKDVVDESSYLSSMASVPWLGEEKKFLKMGEPYLEKKDNAIGISTHSLIGGKPHIIKLLYTLEKYDRLTHEQKNHLLYLVDFLYKLIADAPIREKELFSSKHGLETKVRNFFMRVFQYGGVIERLFSDDNPLFKLHFSLWTFSQGTLKNTKTKFTELMKALPERLSLSLNLDMATGTGADYNTYNKVVFLSDYENRIVSIGFNPSTNTGDSDVSDTNNNANEATLSTHIKTVIEQELINSVGMESMGVAWKEIPLNAQAPTSMEEAKKINIDA